MNYKTILVGVLLAGSMQQTWGYTEEKPGFLDRDNAALNNNNNVAPKQEISDAARLAAEIAALRKQVEDLKTTNAQQQREIDEFRNEKNELERRKNEALAAAKRDEERSMIPLEWRQLGCYSEHQYYLIRDSK